MLPIKDQRGHSGSGKGMPVSRLAGSVKMESVASPADLPTVRIDQ